MAKKGSACACACACEVGSGFEGFDYHLAEALDEEEMSDHCSSSSEEDENNEAVS